MNIPTVNDAYREFTAESCTEKCLGQIHNYANHSLLLGQQEANERMPQGTEGHPSCLKLGEILSFNMLQRSPWHQDESSLQGGPHSFYFLSMSYSASFSPILLKAHSQNTRIFISNSASRETDLRESPVNPPCFLTFMCDFVLFSFIHLAKALQT